MRIYPILIFSTLALFYASSVTSDSPELVSPWSNYLELRVYTMMPDMRDDFLEHFETHYLSSQEDFGMMIWGQFRDTKNLQQFVWLRGYRSMPERLQALLGFYTSEVWQTTSDPVREMMAERATHVHFLEPVSAASGFKDKYPRAEGGSESDRGVVVALLYQNEIDGKRLEDYIDSELRPVALAHGAVWLGLFRSSPEENNFPALPFIQDENILVLFLSYPDVAAFEASESALSSKYQAFETFVLRPGEQSRIAHKAD